MACRNIILAHHKHISANELEARVALVLELLRIGEAGNKTVLGIPTRRTPHRRATVVIHVRFFVPNDVRPPSLRSSKLNIIQVELERKENLDLTAQVLGPSVRDFHSVMQQKVAHVGRTRRIHTITHSWILGRSQIKSRQLHSGTIFDRIENARLEAHILRGHMQFSGRRNWNRSRVKDPWVYDARCARHGDGFPSTGLYILMSSPFAANCKHLRKLGANCQD